MRIVGGQSEVIYAVSRPDAPQALFSDIGVQSLSAIFELTPAHIELIRDLQGPALDHARDAQLVPQGASPLRFLVEGWGCRIRRLADGRRLIFSFVTPGDVLGLSVAHPAGFCDIVALTPGRTVDIEPLRRLLARGDPAHAPITRALNEANRIAEAHLLDHMVRLGAYGAYMATAHLLLELHDRLKRVGLAHAGRFALPVGQRTLALALGLSSVHLNRTLRELRADGHVEHGAGWILLPDPEHLARTVDFMPPTPAQGCAVF